MKITAGQAIGAYLALDKLKTVELPFPERRQLRQIKKALQEEVDFYCETEKELVDKYGWQVDSQGRIDFGQGGAQVKQYQAEISALRATEVELAVEELHLPGVPVSLETEDALNGIISFAE